MENATVLFTDRLYFRNILDDDLELIFSGLSNKVVTKYFGVRYTTLLETREQMEWYKSLETQKSGKWWIIEQHNDNAFIGAIGFHKYSRQHRKAEIGFWLLPEYWGKGFMSEALVRMSKHGFNEMNLHRIEGWVESENKSCISVFERCGYKLEGIARQTEWVDNRWIDLCLFAVLKTEWKI